jgi:hypothetical protein
VQHFGYFNFQHLNLNVNYLQLIKFYSQWQAQYSLCGAGFPFVYPIVHKPFEDGGETTYQTIGSRTA